MVEPRFATPRNPANKSFGPAVGRVAEMLGTPLMPWQQTVADTALEVDVDGNYLYPIVVVSIQRQAGKTTLALATCVWRCLLKPNSRVWHTAQTGLEARDKFRELAEQLMQSPLGPSVKVRMSAGSECIQFPNGSTLRPHPPVPTALHGKQSDLNLIDECWAFTELEGAAILQAIIPTQATRRNAQTILTSTAGDGSSTWFRQFVDRGRAADAGIAYFEWSIADDVNPNNLDEVAAAHPAIGRTIDLSALENAKAAMSDGEYARAYGNRWTRSKDLVVPFDAWERCQTEQMIPDGCRVAFGAAVSVDREHSAICAAAIVDGVPMVELIDYRPGTDWVGERLQELSDRHDNTGLVVDAYGPSSTVVDYLNLNRVKLLPLTTRDVTAACAEVYDRIIRGDLLVRPNTELDAAIEAAAKRNVGDAWAWSRRTSSGCIAALEAATLAVRAVTHLSAPPEAPRAVFQS